MVCYMPLGATLGMVTSIAADSITWAKSDSTQLECGENQEYHATLIENEMDINKTSCEDLIGTYPNGTWNLELQSDVWTLAAMDQECLIWFRAVDDAANVTIGNQDVFDIIQFAIDNFDVGSGYVNSSQGYLEGCPGECGGIQWVLNGTVPGW